MKKKREDATSCSTSQSNLFQKGFFSEEIYQTKSLRFLDQMVHQNLLAETFLESFLRDESPSSSLLLSTQALSGTHFY